MIVEGEILRELVKRVKEFIHVILKQKGELFGVRKGISKSRAGRVKRAGWKEDEQKQSILA